LQIKKGRLLNDESLDGTTSFSRETLSGIRKYSELTDNFTTNAGKFIKSTRIANNASSSKSTCMKKCSFTNHGLEENQFLLPKFSLVKGSWGSGIGDSGSLTPGRDGDQEERVNALVPCNIASSTRRERRPFGRAAAVGSVEHSMQRDPVDRRVQSQSSCPEKRASGSI
jgi:hypothetical protein